MYELLDNTEYLIGTILPMVQEVQRDSVSNNRLSVDVSINNDNGMILVCMTYYDENLVTIDGEESKQFAFYSHDDNDKLGEAFNSLVGYVVKHSA